MQAFSGHMSLPRRRLGIQRWTEAVWETGEKQMTQSQPRAIRDSQIEIR
jgi:hypothetical protein